MKDLRAFEIGIIALKFGQHRYEYELEDSFFSYFEDDFLQQGLCKASITLDKNEQLICAHFDIQGTIRLTCDRSLEEFDYPIEVHQELIYKFAEEEKELSEELIQILRSRPSINIGALLYEFIVLEIPMKKLHPRFREEEEQMQNENDGTSKNVKFIYSSESKKDETDTNQEPDPRWAALKNLKNNDN